MTDSTNDSIKRTSRANQTREKTALILARIPVETVQERTHYFNSKSRDQMDAVDYDMMRENQHSTMTIEKANRQSRVTFGGPRKS